jgi:FAD/FMN-containing dehydrogenase
MCKCGSKYTGYMFHLRFDGDLVDASRRAPDGTCLNGISAIDALDGRNIQPFDLQIQMQTENMLRELNKAAAGFVPPLGPC